MYCTLRYRYAMHNAHLLTYLNYWSVPATPTSIFQAARFGFSCARDGLLDYRRSNSRSRLGVLLLKLGPGDPLDPHSVGTEACNDNLV